MDNTIMTRIPVYYIATRFHDEPMELHFFTTEGKPIPADKVKKVKTKKGIKLFVESPKAKRK
jgi:hypothetical protein